MTKIEELRAAYEVAALGKLEVYDSYEALLCNEQPPRCEEVTEVQAREAGMTFAYATSHEYAHLTTLMHNNLPALLEAVDALEHLLTSFVDLRSGFQERELHEPADVTTNRANDALEKFK